MAYLEVTLTLRAGTAQGAFAERSRNVDRCDWFRDLLHRTKAIQAVELGGVSGPVWQMSFRSVDRCALGAIDPRKILFVELLTDPPDTIVVTGEFLPV